MIGSINYVFNQATSACNVNIKVELQTYEPGDQWYYVTLENSNHGPANPFYGTDYDTAEHIQTLIIRKNSLTDELVKYLLMTDDELRPHAAMMTDVNEYRSALLVTTVLLST